MAITYIASAIASYSSTLSFTSGIDSSYNEYQFRYVNMHPSINQAWFSFQVNAAGQTGFNEVITSTAWRYYHNDTVDAYQGGGYRTDADQAQGTAYQPLTYETGYDNDQACSGMLTLYDPASTTYVKQFTARTNDAQADDYTIDNHMAGYINTTSAIDEISFKFSTGNIDAGSIYMYGVG